MHFLDSMGGDYIVLYLYLDSVSSAINTQILVYLYKLLKILLAQLPENQSQVLISYKPQRQLFLVINYITA
jgi:hypothetical protein